MHVTFLIKPRAYLKKKKKCMKKKNARKKKEKGSSGPRVTDGSVQFAMQREMSESREARCANEWQALTLEDKSPSSPSC